VSVIVVDVERGGLQVRAAVYKHKFSFRLLNATLIPPRLLSQVVLIFDASPHGVCTCCCVLVSLSFCMTCSAGMSVDYTGTMHPAVFIGISPFAQFGCSHAGCCLFPAIEVESMVFAAMSTVRLAVRAMTLAVRDALFLISWFSIVFSVVATNARFSRYLSRQAKVSAEIVDLSLIVTAFAVPPNDNVPATSCWQRRAMCAIRSCGFHLVHVLFAGMLASHLSFGHGKWPET
jgi:hypothetical protein